jgi:hypothetical protein
MRFYSAMFSLILATSAASAATLSDVNGRALVSKGTGYMSAGKGLVLTPGDRLVVEGNGTATVTYNDGCVHAVTAGTVFIVAKASPCTTSYVDAQKFRNRMGQSTTLIPPLPAIAPGAIVVGGVAMSGHGDKLRGGVTGVTAVSLADDAAAAAAAFRRSLSCAF